MRVVFGERLDALDELVARVDVDAGFAIRDRSHRGKALVALARRDNTPGLAPPYRLYFGAVAAAFTGIGTSWGCTVPSPS